MFYLKYWIAWRLKTDNTYSYILYNRVACNECNEYQGLHVYMQNPKNVLSFLFSKRVPSEIHSFFF